MICKKSPRSILHSSIEKEIIMWFYGRFCGLFRYVMLHSSNLLYFFTHLAFSSSSIQMYTVNFFIASLRYLLKLFITFQQVNMGHDKSGTSFWQKADRWWPSATVYFLFFSLFLLLSLSGHDLIDDYRWNKTRA